MVGLASAVSLLTLLCPPASCETFGEKLNPTGYPIGGGPEYVNIIEPSAADIVVDTKSELIEALKNAKSGQVVYVADAAEIDMTGDNNQTIPAGVTLASGRGNRDSLGALIYSDTLTDGADFIPLFGTGGKGVRITGLRIKGPFGEVGDHHYDQIKICNGIMANHEDLEVDNCELWAWNKWAIDLAVAGGAYIHHNYIHHTRRWGFGYGVWVRGEGMAIIEANLFDFCRHHIGSGAQATSSYEARYNICLYHDVQPSFDRHGAPKSKAGFTTHIHHNEFRNPNYAAILLRGNPLKAGHFHNNWFAHKTQRSAFIDRATNREQIYIYDNSYGAQSWKFHPEANAILTPSSGTAPLTVNFDGSGSRDREGGRIIRYEWKIPDTPDPVGQRAFTEKATYTFKEPGRYPVALYASNERGIPGVKWIPVTVYPAEGDYVLSAWVKDSYYGPLKGYIKSQVLIDDEVIWEEDFEGDEGGWKHLAIEVSQWVKGKTSVDLVFRMQADKEISNPSQQIVESFMYVDDVHLFGGTVVGGDFESWSGWKYRSVPANAFDLFTWNYWTGESRSGKLGWVMGNGYNRKGMANSFCEIRQTVKIGKPGEWREK